MKVLPQQCDPTHRGAAIVELALAMLLMFSMLLFIIFTGRFLAERNRILAANRTVAWIYAHRDERAAQAHHISVMDSPEMLAMLREWHFKSTGSGAGVVRLGNVVERQGIFWGGDATVNDITEFAEDTHNEQEIKPDGLDGAYTTDKSPGPNDTAGYMVATALKEMITGIGNMLSQDFSHYQAKIEYGMPLVFPRDAYALFWGDVFSNVSDQDSLDPIEALQMRPGETYVFYSSDAAGACVMPSLDASVDNAFSGLTDALSGFIGMLDKLMKRVPPLYRPHMQDDEINHLPTLNRLEALLIYEIDGYDPDQKNARGEVGFWDFITRNNPWWR